MMELSGSEKELLRSAIGQAFPNPKSLSMFLSGQDFTSLPDGVGVDIAQPYDLVLKDYIDNVIEPEGLMNKLLKCLVDRPRISTQIKSLMDPVDVNKDQWFRIYKRGEVALSYCDREQMFDFFDKYHPYTANPWSKISELKTEQISQSKSFLAIITPFDLEDIDTPDGDIFKYAFEDWLNSHCDRAETPKKFMLLYERDEVLNWWNSWVEKYRGKYPSIDDIPVFLREFRNDRADLAVLKKDLWRFLNDADPPIEANVLLLGIPTISAGAISAKASDIELVNFLGKYNPDRVQYWEDGWAESKRMTEAERAELFLRPPIFVRSAADKHATISGLRGDLILPLARALGYAEYDVARVWRDIVGQFQRVFWRPEGEWWDGTEIDRKVECALIGAPTEIGEKLAKKAGLSELLESKLRTRFENLPDSDPNRELLSTNLQELGKTVVEQGEYETVAVSLDSLDDSVSRFNRSQLNIVAAHDQRTRPGDRQHTISHFEDWDSKIDALVARYFPGREPKIFRIAVLFQNFDKFDGLKFDEGLSVRRWNLLKIKRENDKFVFNPNDLSHLKQAATELLKP
ncbi:hypothetical protein HFO49_03365 [Rhizobium leguminosarum]|uniref:hypothetical protein n=1 Tax=Rhizobium leguminosarum TaxID=384 RepID=UPI001C9471A8|nr:hypothetical protein [Rhizobium leguminosarum]MBY5586527.1 hypothetical protein [Rhizobium leguminosarum]